MLLWHQFEKLKLVFTSVETKNNGLGLLPKTITALKLFKCSLLLWMARMEMDLKLEKISQLFQVLKLCREKKNHKKIYYELLSLLNFI